MRTSLTRLVGRSVAGQRQLATVAVGVSGGVDSSVAAMLLKEQGHDVVGVHMSNWDAAEEAGHEACGEKDARDARKVCERLGIGFHRTSFVREYWNDVFEPLLQGYQSGGTPNPDVACNRFIKFDRFVTHARELGADRVATGHYARLDHGLGLGVNDGGSSGFSSLSGGSGLSGGIGGGGGIGGDGVKRSTTRLLMAADVAKDQSYFLAAVRQSALRLADFPIGHLQKHEVRERAAAAGLHTATKRDSTGICFIGKRKFADFLESYLPQEPGPFVCVDTGRELGQHRGCAVRPATPIPNAVRPIPNALHSRSPRLPAHSPCLPAHSPRLPADSPRPPARSQVRRLHAGAASAPRLIAQSMVRRRQGCRHQRGAHLRRR